MTALIPRTTATQMAAAYQVSVAEIRQAYSLLRSAQEHLKNAFEDRCGFGVMPNHSYSSPTMQTENSVIAALRSDAWRAIADKVNIRQVMSSAKEREFQTWLNKGDELPEVTEENIFAMLEHMQDNLDTFAVDAVKEVFNFLRPPSNHYKTNTEFEIGKRAIISYCLEEMHKWSNRFCVAYSYRQNIRNLDNVFHLLDGKGTIKTYGGPLSDTIEAAGLSGHGETDYFKFRAYKNRSLHLEFKRMDLVQKLNEMAGGKNLKP
jgi:hypothetical protein